MRPGLPYPVGGDSHPGGAVMIAAMMRRATLRAILTLPTPLLRALSGGKAFYRNGRTLDPRLQFIAEASRRYPPLDTLPPQEARRLASAGVAAVAGSLPKGVRTQAMTVPAPGGPRPARLYRPPDQDPAAAVMVFAHQGGGVIGDLEEEDAFCGLLAAEGRMPVLAVDYRLAPEHRYPAGFEDVLAAYRWARDNAAHFGGPAGRAAVGGSSTGGGFAAAICHALKRAGEAQPGQGDLFPLTGAVAAWFLGQYLTADMSPDDPRLSPVREPDLSGLAPAIVALAGFDFLLDQGQVYARRLMDAGVPVTFRCYDSLCHGFTAFTGAAPAAQTACLDIARLARGRAAAPQG